MHGAAGVPKSRRGGPDADRGEPRDLHQSVVEPFHKLPSSRPGRAHRPAQIRHSPLPNVHQHGRRSATTPTRPQGDDIRPTHRRTPASTGDSVKHLLHAISSSPPSARRPRLCIDHLVSTSVTGASLVCLTYRQSLGSEHRALREPSTRLSCSVLDIDHNDSARNTPTQFIDYVANPPVDSKRLEHTVHLLLNTALACQPSREAHILCQWTQAVQPSRSLIKPELVAVSDLKTLSMHVSDLISCDLSKSKCGWMTGTHLKQ